MNVSVSSVLLMVLGSLIFASEGVAKSRVFCFKSPEVLREGGVQSVDSLCLDEEDGKFIKQPGYDTEIEVTWYHSTEPYTIVPGFYDLQVNGAYGRDFGREPEQILEAARLLPQTGVTSFMPTLISSEPEQYAVLRKFYSELGSGAHYMGANILKAHLEGPFITKCGVHSSHFFPCPLTFDTVSKWYGDSITNFVGMVTLAPEIDGVDSVVAELVRQGVVVSLGHTQGVSPCGALSAGATCFTHLFNAMPSKNHRHPGESFEELSPFLQEVLSGVHFYGIIVDGVHVHPDKVRLAFRKNPNLILVSDAVAGLGLEDQALFPLGAEYAKVEAVATLDGTPGARAIKCTKKGEVVLDPATQQPILAGSVTNLWQALNRLKSILGPDVSWETILKSVTLYPAQLLKKDKELYPREGNGADFLVVRGRLKEQDSLQLVSTWVRGKRVYVNREFDILEPQVSEQWDPLRVHVYDGADAQDKLAHQVSNELIAVIEANNKEGKPTVLGLATGSSPVKTYQALIRKIQQKGDWHFLDRVSTYNLDEYVGLALNDPGNPTYRYSYRAFMEENLFKALRPFGLKNTFLPTPLGTTQTEFEKAAIEYQRQLEQVFAKGQMDIQLLGIGENGHIGFNEPRTPWFSETHVTHLAVGTLQVNAQYFHESSIQIPEQAVTMGIQTILRAKRVILIATGLKKADAIRDSLRELSTHFPASALRFHPNVDFYLDDVAASRISR